jgi:hypothetical protein
LYARFVGKNGSSAKIDEAIDAVINRNLDPYTVVEEILK